MNKTIFPYLLGSTWVFDDPTTGLKAEAFVMGMSEMISAVVKAKAVANAETGFALSFSDQLFDGADAELHWLRADDPDEPMGGNWYRGEIAGQVMEGWLCPALLLYFDAAPARLYVRADALPEGIDPIWHDPEYPRRFMGPDDN